MNIQLGTGRSILAALGGGAFSPLSLPSLVRWGDPSRLGLSNGAAVATSTDYSGAGNDFVATTTERPTYSATGLNGFPCLVFDGAANQLRRDALAASLGGTNHPFSFTVIFQHAALVASDDAQCLFMLTTSVGGGGLPTHDLFLREASSQWFTARRDDAALEKTVGGGDPDLNPHVITLDFDGTTGRLYLDGVLVALRAQNEGAATFDFLTLGSHRRAGVTDNFFNGKWGDDFICSASQSAANIVQLHNYLAAKYGLTLTAPSWAPSFSSDLRAWHRDDSFDQLGGGTSNTHVSDGAVINTWYSKAQYPEDAIHSGNVFYTRTYHAGRDYAHIPTTRYTLDPLVAAYASGTAQPCTIFASMAGLTISGSQSVWSLSDGGASGSYLLVRQNSGTSWQVERRTNAGATTTLTASGVTAPDFGPSNFVLIYDGNIATLIVNGVTATLSSAGVLGGGACTLSTGAVGCLLRDVASEKSSAYFSEWGLFNTALSGATLTSLLAYQAARYPVQTPTSRVLALTGDAGTYSDSFLSTAVTADAADVVSWIDATSGNAFRNASSTYKGVLHTGGPNSHKFVRIANTALINNLLGNVFRGSNPFTLTLCIKQATADGSGVALSCSTSDQNADYAYLRPRDTANTPTGPTFQRSNGSGAVRLTDPGNGFAIITVRSNGTYVKISVNGSAETSTNPTGTPAATIDQFSIGSVVRTANPNGILYGTSDIAAIYLDNYDDSTLADRDALNALYAIY